MSRWLGCTAAAACVVIVIAFVTLQLEPFLGGGDAAALTRSVEAHVAVVYSELQLLFETVCQPDSPIRMPHPSEQQRGVINVP